MMEDYKWYRWLLGGVWIYAWQKWWKVKPEFHAKALELTIFKIEDHRKFNRKTK